MSQVAEDAAEKILRTVLHACGLSKEGFSRERLPFAMKIVAEEIDKAIEEAAGKRGGKL